MILSWFNLAPIWPIWVKASQTRSCVSNNVIFVKLARYDHFNFGLDSLDVLMSLQFYIFTSLMHQWHFSRICLFGVLYAESSTPETLVSSTFWSISLPLSKFKKEHQRLSLSTSKGPSINVNDSLVAWKKVEKFLPTLSSQKWKS